MNTIKLGKQGEDFVCLYLKKHGMKLVERNYHCRTGEIDIIACDGDTMVFVEVKTRSNKNFGTAAEAVTASKIKKIISAAQHYIMKNANADNSFRFDVAEVYGNKERFSINYIKNAFGV